jgi:hypothetical protein
VWIADTDIGLEHAEHLQLMKEVDGMRLKLAKLTSAKVASAKAGVKRMGGRVGGRVAGGGSQKMAGGAASEGLDGPRDIEQPNVLMGGASGVQDIDRPEA